MSMDYSLPSCLQQYVPDKRFWKSTKWVTCPECGFEFNVIYSRAIACHGCPESVFGCEYVRCPKCNHEFKMTSLGITRNEAETRSISSYWSKVLLQYCRDFGERPGQ